MRHREAPIGRDLHFIVITSPAIGHFSPLLALSAALQARRCRVTFVHIADAEALVEGSPVSFRAVGARDYPPGALRNYHRLLGAASGLIGTLRMVAATARLSDMLCREVPDAIRELGGDVILADVAEPTGALIARHLRLPHIGVITGLPLHPDPIVPPPFFHWPVDTSPRGRIRVDRAYRVTAALMTPITRALKRHARAWGLSGDPGDVLSPLLTVAQCPPGLDFPRSLPSPPIAWCGPFRQPSHERLDLPDDGRPLVFCSLGTLQGGRFAIIRLIARACADVGARAVIAHCGLLTEQQARSLPGDPLVRDFWPQPAILGKVQAAVVHGGFNTVLDALTAGVPMVAVPIAFEQPGTCARLKAVGAALVIPRHRLTRRRLAVALQRVLEEARFADAAQWFASSLSDRYGAADAAARIMEVCKAVRKPEPWGDDLAEPAVSARSPYG